MLHGRSLKATIMLDAAELLTLPPPQDGVPRYLLRVAVGGRTITADLSGKSVRKALANIREHGVEGVAVMLQGRLEVNNSLAEAGLVAQPKALKPSASAA
jgi:hypothetical protein